jgi:hypothetical protein
MMKCIRSFALIFICAFPFPQAHAEKTPSEQEQLAKKAAVQAGRVVVGAAVGGGIGKVIAGSPAGAAAAILLTPSKIGCGQGETCRK